MGKVKTTTADLKKFSKYVYYWQKELGLFDWSIYVDHDDIDDAYAKNYHNHKGRVSNIVLSKEWPDRRISDKELNACALHECLHLVTADLMCEATSRYTQEFDVERAEESVVVRLTSIISRLIGGGR